MQNYCQKFVGLHALTLIKWCMHVSQVKPWFEIELVAIFVLITDHVEYRLRNVIFHWFPCTFQFLVGSFHFLSNSRDKFKVEISIHLIQNVVVIDPKENDGTIIHLRAKGVAQKSCWFGLIEYNSIESKQTSASYCLRLPRLLDLLSSPKRGFPCWQPKYLLNNLYDMSYAITLLKEKNIK